LSWTNCQGRRYRSDSKSQGRVPRDSRVDMSLRSGEIVVPIGIDKREYYSSEVAYNSIPEVWKRAGY